MNLTRRTFARVCALTATGRALAGALPGLAQVQGEHFHATSGHPVPAIQDTETPAEKDARMQWFREARFGMFIHWGLYSILAGRWQGKEVPGIGEWIMNRASIPVAQYKALAAQFNPNAVQRSGHRGAGQSGGPEVHRDHVKAPRRLCDVRLEGEPVQYRPGHAVQARSAERAGGGVPEAGDPARLLLLAGSGLDGAGRGGVQNRRSPAADVSLGSGAERQLCHVSGDEGDSADPRIADAVRGVSRDCVVRHAVEGHDAGSGREDCVGPESAPKADLEQSAGRWIRGRHGDTRSSTFRRADIRAATGSRA